MADRRKSARGVRCLFRTWIKRNPAVLNTLSSADAQRGYRHAIDEFIEWYCSEPKVD